MSDYTWRLWARKVAYFDLIVSILATIAVAVVVLAILRITGEQNLKDESKFQTFKEKSIDKNDFLRIILLALFLISTVIPLQARFSIQLLEATEDDEDISKTFELSQNWRNYNVLLAIFSLILNNILNDTQFVWIIISVVVIRMTFVFIVNAFIVEIEKKVLTMYKMDSPPPYDPSWNLKKLEKV